MDRWGQCGSRGPLFMNIGEIFIDNSRQSSLRFSWVDWQIFDDGGSLEEFWGYPSWWLEWIHENYAVLVGHFSWTPETYYYLAQTAMLDNKTQSHHRPSIQHNQIHHHPTATNTNNNRTKLESLYLKLASLVLDEDNVTLALNEESLLQYYNQYKLLFWTPWKNIGDEEFVLPINWSCKKGSNYLPRMVHF